jgi:hypothetical protein
LEFSLQAALLLSKEERHSLKAELQRRDSCLPTITRYADSIMLQQLGLALQFVVLVGLPLLCWWQLNFGFSLIWMPALLTVGIVLFSLGTWLRSRGA